VNFVVAVNVLDAARDLRHDVPYLQRFNRWRCIPQKTWHWINTFWLTINVVIKAFAAQFHINEVDGRSPEFSES
jgi:hypothetical protein